MATKKTDLDAKAFLAWWKKHQDLPIHQAKLDWCADQGINTKTLPLSSWIDFGRNIAKQLKGS